jgi:uncharacterized protein (DUF111 family)
VVAGLEALGAGRLLVGEIPLGRGRQEGWHSHGPGPLPAPATLELLRGFDVRGAGEGETVTPTAAAIFAALAEPVRAFPRLRVEATGSGAGTRDPEGYPNLVRVVLGEALEDAGFGEPGSPRDLVLLEANLDDLSPELVADAVGALFAAGALDAWTVPIQMKKGRPAVTLCALGEPASAGRLTEALFISTSTFGVRRTEVRRTELDRRVVTVAVGTGTVRVKQGWLGDRLITATPEHDDVAALAEGEGRPVRVVYEEAAAAAHALRLDPERAAGR